MYPQDDKNEYTQDWQWDLRSCPNQKWESPLNRPLSSMLGFYRSRERLLIWWQAFLYYLEHFYKTYLYLLHVGLGMSQLVCRDQRTTLWSQFSPSTSTQILGIKLNPQACVARVFTCQAFSLASAWMLFESTVLLPRRRELGALTGTQLPFTPGRLSWGIIFLDCMLSSFIHRASTLPEMSQHHPVPSLSSLTWNPCLK